MQDFQKLEVWQKAHQSTLAIYRLTQAFPSEERFGLVSQLRRSISSIGANLAEGCGRGTDADFARHVQVAMGSACETENHLIVARDLGYISDGSFSTIHEDLSRIKRMLTGLIKSLRPSRAADSLGRKPKAESRKLK